MIDMAHMAQHDLAMARNDPHRQPDFPTGHSEEPDHGQADDATHHARKHNGRAHGGNGGGGPHDVDAHKTDGEIRAQGGEGPVHHSGARSHKPIHKPIHPGEPEDHPEDAGPNDENINSKATGNPAPDDNSDDSSHEQHEWEVREKKRQQRAKKGKRGKHGKDGSAKHPRKEHHGHHKGKQHKGKHGYRHRLRKEMDDVGPDLWDAVYLIALLWCLFYGGARLYAYLVTHRYIRRRARDEDDETVSYAPVGGRLGISPAVAPEDDRHPHGQLYGDEEGFKYASSRKLATDAGSNSPQQTFIEQADPGPDEFFPIRLSEAEGGPRGSLGSQDDRPPSREDSRDSFDVSHVVGRYGGPTAESTRSPKTHHVPVVGP